jgi:hypothetical protein
MPLRFTGTAKATTAAADIEAASSSQALINTYSVNFDGVNDHMAAGAISGLNSLSEFSISMWFNGSVDNSTGNMFGAWGAVANNNIGLAPNYDLDIFYFVVRSGSAAGSLQVNSMSTYAPSGQWNHVLVVFDNGDRYVYLNGVQRANDTGVAPSTTSASCGDNVSVGQREGAYYKGLVDEVSTHTIALSASDATAIYNGGMPTDISSYSPLNWWRMGDNNGGTGTTITDQGSGSNNGTLTNGPTFSTSVPS